MKNLSFACLGHNSNTAFAVLVLNEKGLIVDCKAELHDLHAADAFTHTKYDHELTIGECYANYEAWRYRNKHHKAV